MRRGEWGAYVPVKNKSEGIGTSAQQQQTVWSGFKTTESRYVNQMTTLLLIYVLTCRGRSRSGICGNGTAGIVRYRVPVPETPVPQVRRYLIST